MPDGIEDARSTVQRDLEVMEAGTRLVFATSFLGRIVGSTSLIGLEPWTWPVGSDVQRRGRPDSVEIAATWLAGSAQRTRCNTEAKLLMLEHAFDVWDVHAVSFRTDARNERSRRSIERLGARLDGIRRAEAPGPHGRPRDSACYSIIRSEWPAAGAALRERLQAG